MQFNDCQVIVARNKGDKLLSRVMVHIGGCTSSTVQKLIEHFNQQYGAYTFDTKGNGHVWKVNDGGIIVTDMTSFNKIVVSFHNKSEFEMMLPDFIDLSKISHAKFRGVQMDDLTEMESSLINGGFAFVKSPNAFSKLYEGTFGGVEDCFVTILFTPTTKKVAQIVVDYPNRGKWSDLKMDFLKASTALTMKYGSPRDDMKMEFVRTDCEGNELKCLENDSGIVFFYGWNIQEGGVSLKISPEQCVTIRYYDDANTELFKIEKMKKAYEDY